MCSHDGCVYNVKNTPWYIHCDQAENRFVSYLPMNHIAAQFVDTMLPVFSPITMYIARPDALQRHIGGNSAESSSYLLCGCSSSLGEVC